MKFSLVYDHSGDHIEFDVVANHQLIEYFIDKCDQDGANLFGDDRVIAKHTDQLLTELHQALSLTNSVMYDLCGFTFTESDDRLRYLDQRLLNRQHETWVKSQRTQIDVDALMNAERMATSKLGWRLHEMLPDSKRHISLAEAMSKLGLIYPYEEVNMTVHRLETFFQTDIEFKSALKWQVFDNPCVDSMTSNNDVVNFCFGYTYVGRQYYDKWRNWDTDLECQDHYNYETLEYAFQINLARPEAKTYSPEFLSWCKQKQVPPVTSQIPIANAVDIEKNLAHYRTVLYTNSRAGNQVRLVTN